MILWLKDCPELSDWAYERYGGVTSITGLSIRGKKACWVFDGDKDFSSNWAHWDMDQSLYQILKEHYPETLI